MIIHVLAVEDKITDRIATNATQCKRSSPLSSWLNAFQAEQVARGQRSPEEGVRESAHGQGTDGRVQDGAAHRQGEEEEEV